MRRRLFRWTLLATAAAAAMAHTAVAQGTGDARAGKAKAALCAACHGMNGISINPLWPSLAGQQRVCLANQIRAFPTARGSR